MFQPKREFLKRNRGFDFTGYKRTTMERRLRKLLSLPTPPIVVSALGDGMSMVAVAWLAASTPQLRKYRATPIQAAKAIVTEPVPTG